jgi:hypothetical protein
VNLLLRMSRRQTQTSNLLLGLTADPTLRLRRSFGKRQPAVDLPDRGDIAGVVLMNFRELAGALVEMFGEKETTL